MPPARSPAISWIGPAAAELAAGEWNDVGEYIDPAIMPVTRIVNTAIDGISGNVIFSFSSFCRSFNINTILFIYILIETFQQK